VSIGIDAGTDQIKVAALSPAGELIARFVRAAGPDWPERLEPALEELLARPDAASPVGCVVATGAGRHSVPGAAKRVHGILCQAAGVRHSHASARRIVDLGAGATTVIRLGSDGRVEDFWEEREWTACSSRLLRLLARAARSEGEGLEVGAVAPGGGAEWGATSPERLEHEVLHRLAQGEPPEALAARVRRAMAERVLGPAQGSPGATRSPGEWTLTGGAAADRGMVEEVARLIGGVKVAAASLWTGAIGAALFGRASQAAVGAETGTRSGRPGRSRAAAHPLPGQGPRPSRAQVGEERLSGLGMIGVGHGPHPRDGA